ncbi:MAG: hypothetical protein A2527_05595 [Candidatus Lambdaproteobacteria bacterium RIFOXYD2_FULL_50_16]|uniref:Transposase IS4-like domain-containing protein n=1 Tax=Candidatus Lambdaproteobacteria bacterium RIFOXYD2_FULL_50_16 TaxID=1817772 RepID=A0A1F6G985_9PROT|nr:MAG: hypothetical protein A2527_05595 [Candidatus Lambdaproteobacteria bacterium RIFOXYD2_FULL_50_16]
MMVKVLIPQRDDRCETWILSRGGHTTAANRFDGKELGGLVEAIPLKDETIIFADKAYGRAENRALLKQKDLTNGLMKKAVRGKT